MASPHPSSMRVLIRPPISTTAQPPLPPPFSTTLSPKPPPPRPDQPALPPLPPSTAAPPLSGAQPPSPQIGVVVVGFIGRRHSDVSQLINRVIDDNVFGTGQRDTNFCVENWEELKGWFRYRKISYYHDEEKGILYLQFCSTGCPAMEEEVSCPSSSSRYDSELEDREFGDLQGMLFMFTVCHIIIFIQEGPRLDTHILKKFRILQAAKHAMVPSVTPQNAPPSTSKSHCLSSTRPYVSGGSSNTRPLARNGAILNRNASSVSLKSGLGSFTSMLPGQCTPVILFAFIDDFSDISGSGMELVETSSTNQSSSLSSSARANLSTKGLGPVVVLARPVSKSEGGLRKKLQSSLEAQIRFSVKKCRILSGSESSHASSRNGGISNTIPLFTLDASKAIALLDKSSNQSGESLDFATALVEDVLNGKATSDSLLLEKHSQSANKEDIQSVKEFIYRQADILRGRGGLVGGTNTGSAAGVGMVAVAAAAAAAASAASGKTLATPDLPGIGIWSSSSQLILQSILTAKYNIIVGPSNNRKPSEKSGVAMPAEAITQTAIDPLEAAVSCLENGKDLNSKFSTFWCQKSLPAAKDIYLTELPDCYPTSKHEAHLEKALRAFRLAVKGSAVNHFMRKLEEECTSIWTSGRQLCDAVSLTGKPCMHQRHDVEIDGKISKDGTVPHSSGYVFLQACACGRSRRLISDPFDFSSANLTSGTFADCDKLLPALQLPKIENVGPIQPSSWSLIRVGGARYYEPSKGLLQSGFSATQKFLLKWTFFLERSVEQVDSTIGFNTSAINESISCRDVKKSSVSHVSTELLGGTEIQKQSSSGNHLSNNRMISFGSGVSNLAMRKPFSEVVAGSTTGISSFPPLQSRKQPSGRLVKQIKQSSPGYKDAESEDFQGSQKLTDVSSVQGRVDENKIGANGFSEGDPFLQIGSNIIHVNMKKVETIKSSSFLKPVDMYVGFEHECPCGHRFILTPEHLNELGSSYALLEESHALPSLDRTDIKNIDPSKLGKSGSHGKSHRKPNGTGSVKKLRNLEKKKDVAANDLRYLNVNPQFPRVGNEKDQSNIGKSKISDSLNDVDVSLQYVPPDDSASSMLNRNVPIYMDCPHCRIKNKNDSPKIKFAGTVSQLQRIFLVTPPFPVTLATCPIIQFEPSCLPPSVLDREEKMQFSLGCQVILPPESFLSLRLPFVYGVQLEDGTLQSLKPFEHQPERTAWIAKGTTLQVMSREGVYTREYIPKQT